MRKKARRAKREVVGNAVETSVCYSHPRDSSSCDTEEAQRDEMTLIHLITVIIRLTLSLNPKVCRDSRTALRSERKRERKEKNYSFS